MRPAVGYTPIAWFSQILGFQTQPRFPGRRQLCKDATAGQARSHAIARKMVISGTHSTTAAENPNHDFPAVLSMINPRNQDGSRQQSRGFPAILSRGRPDLDDGRPDFRLPVRASFISSARKKAGHTIRRICMMQGKPDATESVVFYFPAHTPSITDSSILSGTDSATPPGSDVLTN